jgi:hypothetical protein
LSFSILILILGLKCENFFVIENWPLYRYISDTLCYFYKERI